PDSIVSGTIAAREGMPIVLAGPNNGTLMVQLDALGVNDVHILGGTAAVDEAAAAAAADAPSVQQVFRHGGPSRVETAHTINAAFPSPADDPFTYLVADGYEDDSWAVVLAATSLAAAQQSAVALDRIGPACDRELDYALIGITG